MIAILIQTAIIGIWGAMLSVQTRRLLRLAHVRATEALRNPQTRSRVWWWLGREEFWHATQRDTLTALQLTILVIVAAWGMTF